MSGERILVVDDDPGIRGLIKTVLDSEDYTVLEAGDGATALKIFDTKGPIHAAVLNVEMQGMDGIELANALMKRGFKNLFFVTGLSYEKFSERIKTLVGHNDNTLFKPFDIDKLYEKVRNLVGR